MQLFLICDIISGKEKRTRKSADKQPGGQRKRKKASDASAGDETEEAHVPSLKNEKARMKKPKSAESDEDEDGFESEKEESVEDSGDEYDLSQYDYLLQKLHYDPEDNAVFKYHSIAALEGNVVVYHCKYNSKSRTWGKVKMEDPIHIGDILNYHNSPSNEENVIARLQEPTTTATKQRGRPKK